MSLWSGEAQVHPGTDRLRSKMEGALALVAATGMEGMEGMAADIGAIQMKRRSNPISHLEKLGWPTTTVDLITAPINCNTNPQTRCSGKACWMTTPPYNQETYPTKGNPGILRWFWPNCKIREEKMRNKFHLSSVAATSLVPLFILFCSLDISKGHFSEGL